MNKKQMVQWYDIVFMIYVLWHRFRILEDLGDVYALSIAHLPQFARTVKYILWFLTPVSLYLLVSFVFRRYLNFGKKEKQPLRFTWDVVLIFTAVAVYFALALYENFVIPHL